LDASLTLGAIFVGCEVLGEGGRDEGLREEVAVAPCRRRC